MDKFQVKYWIRKKSILYIIIDINCYKNITQIIIEVSEESDTSEKIILK